MPGGSRETPLYGRMLAISNLILSEEDDRRTAELSGEGAMAARADEPRIIVVTDSFDLCFDCGPLASTLRRTGSDGRIGAFAGPRR